MANKTLYILDAAWKGGAAVKKADADLEKLGDTAGTKTPMSFAKMATGIGVGVAAFAAVGVAAKAAWNALGEGGELLTIEKQFTSLSDSINTTSDSLLNSLDRATFDMISDAELMSSAVEIINTGLADTEEGVVRLAAASGTLGIDMNQLTAAMLNDSRERLDQLGLSASRVIEIRDELNASGFIGDAFDEAVVVAMEEKIEAMGGAASDASISIDQVESSIQNVKNAGFSGFAEGATEALDEIAMSATRAEQAYIDLANNAGSAFGSLTVNVAAGATSQSDTLIRLGNTVDGLWFKFQRLDASASGVDFDSRTFENTLGQNARMRAGRGSNASYSDTSIYDGYAYAGESFTSSTSGYIGGSTVLDRELANEVSEVGEKMRRLGIQQEYVAETAEEAAIQTSSFGGSMMTTRSEADMLADELFKIADASGAYYIQAEKAEDIDPLKSLKDSIAGAGGNAYDLYLFDIASGLKSVEEAQDDLNKTYMLQRNDQLGEMVASGQITAEEAIGMMNDATLSAEEFYRTLDEKTNQEYVTTMAADTGPAEQSVLDFLAWAALQSETLTIYADVVQTTPKSASTTTTSGTGTLGGVYTNTTGTNTNITINNNTRSAELSTLAYLNAQKYAVTAARMTV